ncbi:MAG: hypothetical protein KF729_38855 [Sandaracinaceae bacterium]|nr:hypothetical protein [Sandaracinaceae bacterium]
MNLVRPATMLAWASALAATAGINAAAAQEALYARDDVLARAPLGVGPEHVGRFYDVDFRPLVGGANTLVPDPTHVQTIPVAHTRRVFRALQSEAELRANAGAWGIAGRVSTADVSRHAYFRAYQLDMLTQVNESIPMPAVVPARAAYYVSGVFVGRMIEAHFSSNSTRTMAGLEASFGAASGGIETWAQQQQVSVQIDTLGLEPSDSDALFAQTQGDVQRLYRANGPPRAIFVRFTRVPSNLRAQTLTEVVPYRITVDRVVFPQTNPARNTAWDGFGGRPDITFRVVLDGRTIYEPTAAARDTFVRDLARERGSGSPRVGVIDSVSIAATSVLDFQFFDQDLTASGWDRAGSLIVTAADLASVEGSREFAVGNGVRFTLSVTRIE